jgi:hypothetical protein
LEAGAQRTLEGVGCKLLLGRRLLNIARITSE